MLERINQNGHEIIRKSNEHDAIKLDKKLNSLDEKWKNMIVLLTSLKEKFMVKNNASLPNQNAVKSEEKIETGPALTSYQILTHKFVEQNEWLNKCERLINKNVSPADELETERVLFEIKVLNSFCLKNLYKFNILC